MDVETKGKDGWTPLMVAASAGHINAMQVTTLSLSLSLSLSHTHTR